MLYMDFQNKVAALGYRAELDRIKVNGEYAQKNRVHVFDNNKPEEIAKIFEFDAKPMIDGDLDAKLVDLINKFANTPINERGIKDDKAGYSIHDLMPDANIRE